MTISGGRRRVRIVAAVAAIGSLGLGTAADAAPPNNPVTTNCRVRVERAVLASGGNDIVKDVHGAANPQVRPFGSGDVQVGLLDGSGVQIRVNTLSCRRDGGDVPESGGANIADMTGPARFIRDGKPVDGWGAIHVEDRGSGRETQDYVAVRVVDDEGNEVLFDANYLASGNVELVPVNYNALRY